MKKLNENMPKSNHRLSAIGQKIKKGFQAVGRFLFVRTEHAHSERFEKVVDVLNRYAVLFHIALSLSIVFVVELISRRSVLSALNFIRIHPLAYLYNSFIVFASLMLVFLFRRRGFFRVLITSFWVLLGIINGCILSNRVTPFTYTDLKCVSDLLSMTNTNYFTAQQATAVVFGFVIFILLMVALFIKGPRYQGKKHPVAYPLSVLAVLFIGIPAATSAATNTHIVDTYFYNIAQGYEDNGFIYSFSSSVVNRGMSKPETYSKETIDTIENQVNTQVAKTKSSKPNIICILLESFVDPEELTYLKTNKDPISFYHYLEDNYTSGYLTVPVVGAGTANTEFEILTGMSMQYFGTGEYPYKTILKQTDCESIASDLSKIGYGTHVVHNNGGNFYSRANAFSMMGFDTFTSKECMNITEFTPNGNWAEDAILVNETIKALDATEGSDFVYTITVGTHGDYPKQPILDNPEYVVTGANSEESANQWTYFVNQAHKTDLFIQNLITELDKRDEDTIVVMFGDHLPTMGLTNEDTVPGDIYKTKYQTWNNMGLEKQDADLYAYQLLASVTDSVGIHEGTIWKYHQNELANNEAKLDRDAYLNGLENLQYDLLYGDRFAYNGEDLYPATEIVMGIDEVVIEKAQRFEISNALMLTGSSFTPWTRVYVNDSRVDSVLVDGKHMRISLDDVEDGDVIQMKVLGSSNSVFRVSNEFVYDDPTVEDTETETTEE
ncbi:LTA synthase family protein [Agathobacter sp.]|uniref:LTA synthase family protein n=1 Tax=Agathobacter sp. TaxID=2021311 RepID=UPI00257CBA5B|nr:LTA synthase family protein [Agathobacter sp.]